MIEEGLSPESVSGWRDRESSLDPGGMRDHIAGFPDQLVDAVRVAEAFLSRLSRPDPGTDAIVVVGMGGSAIGADLVAASTVERRRLPLVVVRGYDLPAWLDERAFVIASSYSGNTEETLAAYRASKDRGMTGAALTTGGKLAQLAREAGDPVYRLPEGLPPRAALGASYAGCALVAARVDAGLDPGREADRILRAAEELRSETEGWLAWDGGNPVLAIAAALDGAIPIVYGGHPVSIAAAYRWKCQLNENAKRPAWSGALPEHNHNEIVGFEDVGDARSRLALVHLETPWDHPRVARRFSFVRRFCEDRVAVQHRILAEGPDPTSGMLWLCHLGDCASFLASVIGGNDPTPVASIDQLKQELRDRAPERSQEERA